MTRRSYRDEQAPSASPAHQVLQMACRVAIRFPGRVPTPTELTAAFGMSRATAYRWVSAMRAARGE